MAHSQDRAVLASKESDRRFKVSCGALWSIGSWARANSSATHPHRRNQTGSKLILLSLGVTCSTPPIIEVHWQNMAKQHKYPSLNSQRARQRHCTALLDKEGRMLLFLEIMFAPTSSVHVLICQCVRDSWKAICLEPSRLFSVA